MLRRVIAALLIILAAQVTSIASAYINVTVTIPVEAYALRQAFGNLLHINVLVSGYVNPHYVPVTTSMVKTVLSSQIYVPLWHLPLEYRLASLAETQGVSVPSLQSYEKNGLIFLKYPETNLNNTHGWWLYPKNILALVKSVGQLIEKKFPQYQIVVHEDIDRFSNEIELLENNLLIIGERLRKDIENKRITIICACPALQYLMKSLGLDCIVLREVSQVVKVSHLPHGELLVLLADFQRGTKIDYYMHSLVERVGGLVVYIPILGIENLNMTYSEYMMYIVGKVREAVQSMQATSSSIAHAGETMYIYVMYVLIVVTSIMLVLTVSALRRLSLR